MDRSSDAQLYMAKVIENLASAASELANARYNACANRCYYACFQMAIVALLRAGVASPGRRGEWGHDFVQAQFAGVLISARKLYPAEQRSVLIQLHELRARADYETTPVSAVQAERALRRARAFVQATTR